MSHLPLHRYCIDHHLFPPYLFPISFSIQIVLIITPPASFCPVPLSVHTVLIITPRSVSYSTPLRCDRFLSCFSHVSSSIDPIYKALTSSSSHRLGGTAYLVLESEAEPFSAGVKYSAMPPSKRFRDMEQLSGGEKTVAALALLFAIHR